MNNIQRQHGTLKIMTNKDNYSKPYAGYVWVSYNQNYGIGFWQQVTKYYTTTERLKKYNPKFKDIIYFEVD